MAVIKKVTVERGQTIFDILLQEYGSIAPIRSFCKLNDFNSFNVTLNSGDLVKVDVSKIVNKDVVNFYKFNQLKPASL